MLLVGLIARELGGGARAQTLAALAWAVAPLTVISGHLLSTTTLDLLVWTLISWLVVRLVRTRAHRLWLVIGLTGVGLLNKYLVAFFVVALVAGLLAAGPRTVLRTPWLPAGAALALLISLPVVPLAVFAGSPQPAVNGDSAETVGWPQLAATVGRVYRTLPTAERGATTIVTRNYGEAGALARYGDAYGLPTAYSGHNAYHRWGPPPSDRSAVTLFFGARSAGELRRHWREVEPAARIDNGYGVDNEEQGAQVWICRGLRKPWPEIWPAFRHLG